MTRFMFYITPEGQTLHLTSGTKVYVWLWLWLRRRAVVLQPECHWFDHSLLHLYAKVSLGKILNPEWPLI